MVKTKPRAKRWLSLANLTILAVVVLLALPALTAAQETKSANPASSSYDPPDVWVTYPSSTDECTDVTVYAEVKPDGGTTLDSVTIRVRINSSTLFDYVAMTNTGTTGAHGGTIYSFTISESNFSYNDTIHVRIKAVAKYYFYGWHYLTKYKPADNDYYDIPVNVQCVATITGDIKPDGSDAESNGQWYLSSAPGTKYNDGGSVDVTPGEYTVVFTDVDCWDTPASQTFTVSTGENKTVIGTYTHQTGLLEISISYDIALQFGETAGTATVTEDGVGVVASGMNDGDQLTIDKGVKYIVSFSTIPYYNTPADYEVMLECEENQIDVAVQSSSFGRSVKKLAADVYAPGEYIRKKGGLTVILQDDGVAPGPAGAEYTITGTGGIFPVVGSAATPYMVYQGYSYSTDFNSIPNYYSPTPAPVLSTLPDGPDGGVSDTVYGNYIPQTGSIQAWCSPTAPTDINTLGAKWFIFGFPGSHFHGQIVSNLPLGNYTIGFVDVDGWITPFTRVVTISFDGEVAQTVGLYVENAVDLGDLQVFIEPKDEVIPEGARWRPLIDAGAPIPAAYLWKNSGDIITGLPVGPVGIEFDVAPGWVLPELTGGKIVANKLSKYTGEYVRPLIVHKADYNGDGLDDLASFDRSTGKWSVVTSGISVSPAANKVIIERKFGKKNDIPAPGDYDGDGLADLAYFREKKGLYRINLSDGTTMSIHNFGKDRDIPVPGDYDGDGTTDAALFRPTTGEWFFYGLFDQLAPGAQITSFKFGWFGTVPVPGDYNGDGRTDLAVYDVKARTWHVAFYNAKKGTWVKATSLQTQKGKVKLPLKHGEIGNLPIQADYDGDRATDPAIFRRSDANFNIYNQYEIQVGRTGDMPVPDDWAGLGRVIPAVFREKEGRWIAVDNLLSTRLLNARHGAGETPLMSGR